MKFSFISILSLSIVIVIGCAEPKPTIDSKDLIGNWTLIKAERDSKETATLVGLTFQFKPDDFIKLNLPHPNLNAETDYKYEIQDNTLNILSAGLTFEITALKEDQLIMKSILEENEFTFWLSK